MSSGLLFVGMILMMTTSAVAQPGDPGGDPDVPIRGTEILLVAGSLLGVKMIRDMKKPKRQ